MHMFIAAVPEGQVQKHTARRSLVWVSKCKRSWKAFLSSGMRLGHQKSIPGSRHGREPQAPASQLCLKWLSDTLPWQLFIIQVAMETHNLIRKTTLLLNWICHLKLPVSIYKHSGSPIETRPFRRGKGVAHSCFHNVAILHTGLPRTANFRRVASSCPRINTGITGPPLVVVGFEETHKHLVLSDYDNNPPSQFSAVATESEETSTQGPFSW